MKQIQYISVSTIFVLFFFFSCSNDDDSNEISCPEVTNSYPLLLGNWIFTGTIINGNLLIEECDLLTTLEVSCNELSFTSFGGNNCSTSNTSLSNFRIDNNTVIYLDQSGNETFAQEIITLNETTLVLRNASGNSTDIVTENWERQ